MKKKILKNNPRKSRIYKIWGKMKNRCYNKNSERYILYGARGIVMCEEWNNDFLSFYNWAITNGYKKNLSIDRINNNGNYEPSNCKWSTMKEQCRNRRTNKVIYYRGKSLCISEWAELLGIKYGTLWSRLNRGFSVKKALGYK